MASNKRFESRQILVWLVLVPLLLLWSCADADQPGIDGAVGASAQLSKDNPGCINCHAKIEASHKNVAIACTDCHGGEWNTTIMAEAHVQKEGTWEENDLIPPIDEDLPYQQFKNPSNLRVVENSCGQCHAQQVQWVLKSMMATSTGHHAGGLYLNGVDDTKTPTYGTFPVEDNDGIVPTEQGAVQRLEQLIEHDPHADPSLFESNYAAVPGQACARCHLWTRGKGFRGATKDDSKDGTYRADGCAACHMPYSHDGLSQSADSSIDHTEKGHPMSHQITKAINTETCVRCHHRGARIGLNFTGRQQMPPRLPSGPGVPGTTDFRFNGSYHYTDAETNPPDVHHDRGIHCIDCHTQAGIMGDGNLYGHMDQATKIECRMCHGLPDKDATLIDKDGLPLNNVTRRPDGTVVLVSKVDGVEHLVPQIKDIVNAESSHFNPLAAKAMDHNHLKEQGGLECFACHSRNNANCFGCHFERDERETARNFVTRQEEVGAAKTNNKMWEVFRHYTIGKNAQGKVSPFIVGCHPIADVTAADGTKIMDYVMPKTTVNGVSGLAFNPSHNHTVATIGQVRKCIECHRSPPTLGFGTGNFDLARTHAYAAADDGVRVYERWSEPTKPKYVTTISGVTPISMAVAPNGVTGRADYLYVAAGTGGLQIFDMRNGIPEKPVAGLDINAVDVARKSRYLYVLVAGEGLRIFDNANYTDLTQVGAVPMPSARKIVPWGIDLFIAAGEAGMLVVDIADHNNPTLSGSLAGINAHDILLYSHFQRDNAFAARAYVADPDVGVHIVDLLPEFSSPRLIRTLSAPGAVTMQTTVRYLKANDTTPSREHDYLYVGGGATIHTFDITIPNDVTKVSTLEVGGSIQHMDLHSHPDPPGVNDYILIANSELGPQLADFTIPLTPQICTAENNWCCCTQDEENQGLEKCKEQLVCDSAAPPALRGGVSQVIVDVQRMDRFIDEQGNMLKENSHPGVEYFTREQIIKILRAKLD